MLFVGRGKRHRRTDTTDTTDRVMVWTGRWRCPAGRGGIRFAARRRGSRRQPTSGASLNFRPVLGAAGVPRSTPDMPHFAASPSRDLPAWADHAIFYGVVQRGTRARPLRILTISAPGTSFSALNARMPFRNGVASWGPNPSQVPCRLKPRPRQKTHDDFRQSGSGRFLLRAQSVPGRWRISASPITNVLAASSPRRN